MSMVSASQLAEYGFAGVRDLREVYEKFDTKEERRVRLMFSNASAFSVTLDFMQRITGYYYGLHFLDLVGVFLWRIKPPQPQIPDWIWIVAGPVPSRRFDGTVQFNEIESDMPSAVVMTEGNPNPACALQEYIEIVRFWIETVRTEGDLEEAIPVAVPKGMTAHEYANQIEPRLAEIEKVLLQQYAEQLSHRT
jgi:hypothetical protein